MERPNGDDFILDTPVRLRQQRDLIEQLKSDYQEINRLDEKVATGKASKEEKEHLLRLQSWLQVESRVLREIEREEIETMICGEMKKIL